MLKFVYSFFLGVLLAVFVGVGVATFYPEPKAPEYPAILQTTGKPVDEYTADQRLANQKYEADNKAYTLKTQDYSRNVAIIVLVAAVILLVVGLAIESRANVLADGMLLGGTFTLLYSIGRSFASSNPKYTFTVVTVGLLVTMFVGYRKFISPDKPAKAKKAKAK